MPQYESMTFPFGTVRRRHAPIKSPTLLALPASARPDAILGCLTCPAASWYHDEDRLACQCKAHRYISWLPEQKGERQAHLKALRTERTRVEGAVQNMFDFIKQGVVSARDADFTARLAAQRTRRADLEQEILLVERQLSAVDRRVTPEAVERLGDVILMRLRSGDHIVRQGYARRFIAKVVVAPDTITISGPIKPLEIAVSGDPDQQTPPVPSLDREWCPTGDKYGHSDHWRICISRC